MPESTYTKSSIKSASPSRAMQPWAGNCYCGNCSIPGPVNTVWFAAAPSHAVMASLNSPTVHPVIPLFLSVVAETSVPSGTLSD